MNTTHYATAITLTTALFYTPLVKAAECKNLNTSNSMAVDTATLVSAIEGAPIRNSIQTLSKLASFIDGAPLIKTRMDTSRIAADMNSIECPSGGLLLSNVGKNTGILQMSFMNCTFGSYVLNGEANRFDNGAQDYGFDNIDMTFEIGPRIIDFKNGRYVIEKNVNGDPLQRKNTLSASILSLSEKERSSTRLREFQSIEIRNRTSLSQTKQMMQFSLNVDELEETIPYSGTTVKSSTAFQGQSPISRSIFNVDNRSIDITQCVADEYIRRNNKEI